MEKTKYVDREIPKISLHDFDSRIDIITRELVDAAENVGFFSVIDHGLSLAEIESMFQTSESFFSLPDSVKANVPWNPNNVGWEKCSQVRPSTGMPDIKESYQMQFGENMNGMWLPDENLPGFQERSLRFMRRVQGVSEKLMICLARGLGFEDDFFIKAHDITRPNSQTCCRLLHYYPTPRTADGTVYQRASAHADWGFLTVLFQRDASQSGLEICPGRETVTEFGRGDAWTKVHLSAGDIICNIGDLLMSWSDDRFKSTFHRVKAPCEEGDYYGERYSIAFFNQPCKDTRIQGPLKKFPMVTGEEFTREAAGRYYRALQEKLEEEKKKNQRASGFDGDDVRGRMREETASPVQARA
ncbi:putative gibberellin 20 oxidase [Pseudovirgaria hyperparasitica]|uniref:Gibberellin 20 oxidase n=1 Tax=Pseudovirgaria hyperparasitica TaxID=470096 RepID=A0A6A6W9P9_9PEZI|nr:putative gibberellin 20 oxidase [Pseudovirgaria hyperparasitica]KAF2758317.1 putative gibberellin 20 oxidase [Pseudovirgaria hyperparasitica]